MYARRGGRSSLGFWALLALAGSAGSFVACSTTPPADGSGGTTSGGQAGETTGGSSAGGAAAGGAAAGGSDPTGSGGFTTGSPNWSEDLAPLVYRECVGCHRTGGVAPFPLETFEDAFAAGVALTVHTASRHMPPMPVDGSGSCNTFSNARWLTDDEIALFAEWNDAGKPQGDPSLAPDLPEPPPSLDEPDIVLDPGEEYLPNDALDDDYRCFVIDSGLTEDQYITAYEVNPGDARVVHHAIVYEPTSDSVAQDIADLDAAEAGPGYTCFGGVGVDAEPRVLWAPGGGYVQMPQDTGVLLTAGRPLILQVHYNLKNGSFPDRTTVELSLADEVAQPAIYQPIGDLDMVLEPGLEDATTTREFSAFVISAVVHGVIPHMHTLGRELSVTTDADGEDHCLVTVDRWDFHSQNAWWYAEPLRFDSVDSVSITCSYDTTDRTEQVRWGEGTQDEMCLTYLYMTTE